MMCLFLTVPWVALQCLIVAFPGHSDILAYFSIFRERNTFFLIIPCGLSIYTTDHPDLPVSKSMMMHCIS